MSKPSPEELAEQISNEYKQNLKCEEFADEMQKLMEQEGVTGERLFVQSDTGFMWSEKYGLISENGNHHAIKIGDTIFDNLNPEGIGYNMKIIYIKNNRRKNFFQRLSG